MRSLNKLKSVAGLTSFQLFMLTYIALAISKWQYAPIRYTHGLRAEFWAEGGTKYFSCAHYTKSLECFLQTDAGYLAFLPRTLSLTIEFLEIPLIHWPLAQQISVIVIMLACLSCVSLKAFEPFLGSAFSRFLLAVVMGWYLEYDLHSFSNLSYFLIIPASLMLAYLIVEPKIKWPLAFGVGLFVSLAILSKGILVGLVPMVALVVVFNLWTMRWPIALGLLVPVIASSALQISTLLASRTQM
ncbi:MAG: hypothetical protein EOP04_27215, partial [Proteobacteria bacterium]